MSQNMFKLDLDKLPEFVIKHPTLDFEVTISPIPKIEEVKIDEKLKGGERIKISNTKRNGFRLKKGDQVTETMEIPNVNVPLRNKLIALKTWVAWNIADYPCDKTNISKLFDNFYDTHAVPIIEGYERQIDIIRGEEVDAEKN